MDAMVSRRKGMRERADERSKTNRVFTDTVIRLDGRERAFPNPTRCKFSVEESYPFQQRRIIENDSFSDELIT